MARFIYVVDRNRPDLQERLSADFAGQDVLVVRNRREGERRRDAPGGASGDRRGTDRRRERALDEELRTEGYFLTGSSDSVMIVVS